MTSPASRLRGPVLASLSLATALVAVDARALEVRVYLDTDNSQATGCTAVTTAGPLAGVERELAATVDTSTNPHVLTALATRTCAGGVFGPPAPLAGPYPVPWGVGDRNGGSASDVVEMYLPLDMLRNVHVVRLAFTATDADGADALLTTGGGPGDPPILLQLGEEIPALGPWGALALALALGATGLLLGRRLRPVPPVLAVALLAAGVAWAAVLLDGDGGDWQVAACGQDVIGDAGPGVDIACAHACPEGDVLFLRLDAGRNAAPAAVDDAVSTTETAPLTGDVLAANPAVPDSDADLDPLAVVAVDGSAAAVGIATPLPSGALVTVQSGGSFTYEPHGAFDSLCPASSATDSFTYTVSDGHGGSATATVTVTVNGTEGAAIDIEKLVNGEDADEAPGPSVFVGATVQWTYVVTNTGAVDLSQVSVTDDRGVAVSCPKTALQPGETMTCTASDIVGPEQYVNVGTATGRTPCAVTVSDTDPAHYYGVHAAITLEKLTNGIDADTAPGPGVTVGATVLWTYVATNAGTVALTNVSVTDSRGVTVTCPKTTLAPGESMTCTGSGTATAGQYSNVGTASGTPAGGSAVTASDPSHYYGQPAGTQGCTVGFWKNHADSWPPTGYFTTQKVMTVFSNAQTYYPLQGQATLLQALEFMGGQGNEGAAEIVVLNGVAALLNASHPSVAYPRTAASVITDVNAALASGSRDTMLLLAAALSSDNNLGCPLN